jgi:hypothetical protein
MKERKFVVYYQDENYINKRVVFETLEEALAFAKEIEHLPFELTEL